MSLAGACWRPGLATPRESHGFPEENAGQSVKTATSWHSGLDGLSMRSGGVGLRGAQVEFTGRSEGETILYTVSGTFPDFAGAGLWGGEAGGPRDGDPNMLVLSRETNESVVVGESDSPEDTLKVTVLEIRGGKVRLGFEAKKEVPVHRWEVWQRICREDRSTRTSSRPATPAQDLDRWQDDGGNGSRSRAMAMTVA